MTRTRSTRRPGGALYVAIIGMTLIVSLLGLTGLSISRIERREALAINDRLIARSHARSGVELALRQLNENANWRSTYSNNVETTTRSLGTSSVGTVSWKVADSDGSLTNPDTRLTVKGIGRIGDTLQVNSIEVQPGQVGPSQLRTQTSASLSNDDLANNKWWCQYLRVTLPSNAIGWKISTVEIYAIRKNGSRAFRLRVYEPLANFRPSSTIIDSADLNSSAVPTLWSWCAVALTSSTWLPPAQGVCIAIETTASGAPIELAYRSGGMAEAHSGLVRGNPTWQAIETDKALRYRVHGYYTTAEGVYPVAGSWGSDEL